jgi:hypothetical protein
MQEPVDREAFSFLLFAEYVFAKQRAIMKRGSSAQSVCQGVLYKLKQYPLQKQISGQQQSTSKILQ